MAQDGPKTGSSHVRVHGKGSGMMFGKVCFEPIFGPKAARFEGILEYPGPQQAGLNTGYNRWFWQPPSPRIIFETSHFLPPHRPHHA